MEKFRGHICDNKRDYFQKERLIHRALNKVTDYNSGAYCGKSNKPDLFLKDGRPVIVAIRNRKLINLLDMVGLTFEMIDYDLIRQQ